MQTTERPSETTTHTLRNRILGLAGGLGIALAIVFFLYQIRPVLTTSTLPPLIARERFNGRFSITNTGPTPISHVEVECRGNKALFARQHTFEMNGYVIIDEYAVPKVEPGESFVADCEQPWHLHADGGGGLLWLGAQMIPDPAPLIIDFTINQGKITLNHPGKAMKGFCDLSGYTDYPLTGIDASLVVRYSIPFLPYVRYSKTIHLIAEDQGQGIEWRIAPSSEPILPDAKGGMRFRSGGNKIRLGKRHT